MFENRSDAATDILHEYFVPREGFHRLWETCGGLFPSITRIFSTLPFAAWIRMRTRSALCRCTLVFIRDVVRAAADARRRRPDAGPTRSSNGVSRKGRYYLPYRLMQLPSSFTSPILRREFFAKKKECDPQQRFQNSFTGSMRIGPTKLLQNFQRRGLEQLLPSGRDQAVAVFLGVAGVVPLLGGRQCSRCSRSCSRRRRREGGWPFS